MTAHVVPPRVIDISINLDNEWTPNEWLEVLINRLLYARGYEERAKIQSKIETAEIFVSHADDPASQVRWLEYRELFVC